MAVQSFLLLFCVGSGSLVPDSTVASRVGHCRGTLLQQLGQLHHAHLHANLLQAGTRTLPGQCEGGIKNNSVNDDQTAFVPV